MSFSGIRRTLADFGANYLVLDVGCLYVATTLREEIWLYREKEDPWLLDAICKEAGEFNIRDVLPDRDLFTFSGGEQAILAALLILSLIESFQLTDINLLLCGVLESLSGKNRRLLVEKLKASARRGRIRPHVIRENRVHCI